MSGLAQLTSLKTNSFTTSFTIAVLAKMEKKQSVLKRLGGPAGPTESKCENPGLPKKRIRNQVADGPSDRVRLRFSAPLQLFKIPRACLRTTAGFLGFVLLDVAWLDVGNHTLSVLYFGVAAGCAVV